MEVYVGEEQHLTIQLDAMRDADITHRAALARGIDRLHHRLLGADALQYRVCTDSTVSSLDASHALFAAFGHDFSRAEFACELLPGFDDRSLR